MGAREVPAAGIGRISRVRRAVLRAALLAALPAAGPAAVPALLAAAGGGSGGLQDGPWTLPAPLGEEVTARFNRGVSLMERQEAAAAVEEFRKVAEALPRWIPGRINLGISLLNSQRDADLPACERTLKEVLKDDPANPQAHYALGMLYLHGSEMERAREEFEATLRADPADACSLYQLGTIARTKGDVASAEKLFRRVIGLSPHFSSAYYALSRLAFLAGSSAEGRLLLDRFMELERARVGLKPGMKYTEMGRHADVVRNVRFPPGPVPPPAPALKAPASNRGLEPLPPANLAGSDPAARGARGLGPRIAGGDLDGDGDGDLFVATASEAGDRLYLGDGSGSFTDATRKGGVRGPGGTSVAALGDYDGDGDLDIFAARGGGASLYRNSGSGAFEDSAPGAWGDAGGSTPADAAFADLDRDGDLDLFVAARDGSSRLHVNLGTGRFEDRASAAGLGDSPAPARGALLCDFDGDGDTDIFVIVEGAPNRLLLNDRPLRFRKAPAEAGMENTGPASIACPADLDGDGLPEIVLARGASAAPLVLRNRGAGRFLAEEAPGAPAAAVCVAGDFDADGSADLLFAGCSDRAVLLLLGDGRGSFDRRVSAPDAAPATSSSALRVDREGEETSDVVLCGAGEPPLFLEVAPPAEHHSVSIELRGARRGEDFFSNARGIGARVEVKAGGRWSVREAGAAGERADGRIRAGIGPRSKADYVRILWPDGLIQSELEIPAGRRVAIDQVQRKASSCPLVFAWDGERFGFVTDILGGGGLGFLYGPGRYAPPDPTEDLRIPPGALKPCGGKLLLRLPEPFEEVCYLDRISLVAVDHPEAAEVYPEERFLSGGTDPTGRLVAFEKSLLPLAARDLEGRDVLELVSEIDRRAPRLQADPRFPGFAREHALELEFGDLLARSGEQGDVVLVIDGWVEYTYSHVVYAAAQAGIGLHPPVLEVPGARGGWRTAVEDMGYPAGLPRTIVVPIPRDALTAGRLRIRTNLEISWDRVRAAVSRGGQGLRVAEAPLLGADLRYLGRPGELSPGGRGPVIYDYERKSAGVAFRGLRGRYTRFGDVKALLAKDDDEHVILGEGEEVALEFDGASLPALEPGRSRTFILRARGYCKDRDPHTAENATVEPLPFRAMSAYPYPGEERYPDDEEHRRYQREWNCRVEAER